MFRKRTGEGNKRKKQWDEWITLHRPKLVSMGLAPEVYLDQDAWQDFLENGHLHWHESSGFDFTKLPLEHQTELLRFLETEAAESNLLGWLRVRFPQRDHD